MVVQVLGISGSPIPNSNTDRADNYIRCGYGDQCAVSGIKMIHGPEATVESVGVRAFEEDQSLKETAREPSERIRQAVLGQSGWT